MVVDIKIIIMLPCPIVKSVVLLLALVGGGDALVTPFYHVIERPTISYDMGLQLIHTPENILLMSADPVLTLFRLKEPASRPQKIDGNYSFISFDLVPSSMMMKARKSRSALHNEHKDIGIRMLTNKKHESHYVVMDQDEPICTMNMVVKKLGPRGHTLSIEGQYYGEKELTGLWKLQMFIILAGLMLESMCLHVFCGKETVAMGRTTGKYALTGSRDEDYYLKLYRKGVLRMPNLTY